MPVQRNSNALRISVEHEFFGVVGIALKRSHTESPMCILHGDIRDDPVRVLWSTLPTPCASSWPGLLSLARLPARPQATVAARQTPVRPRLPGQPARRPTGVGTAQPRLLAALPWRPSVPAAVCTWTVCATECGYAATDTCKDGRVIFAVRPLSDHATSSISSGKRDCVDRRDRAAMPVLSVQDGRVKRGRDGRLRSASLTSPRGTCQTAQSRFRACAPPDSGCGTAPAGS